MSLSRRREIQLYVSGKFSKPEVFVRTKNNMNFTTNFTRITNMWFFIASSEY
jgi:hypothetical protein